MDRNGWFLTVNLYERLVQEVGPLLDGSGLVEPLRRIKSAAELRQIEQAGIANDAGMQAGLAATRAGASENDVAAAIMGAAIKAGSEYVGMEPFVTSGARSGIPHTTWRRRQIEPGDVVALETCACYNRYHAALFRTVAVGQIPQRAEDMFKVCQEGLDAAIEKLRPGNSCADVHNAAQAVIDRHGFTAATASAPATASASRSRPTGARATSSVSTATSKCRCSPAWCSMCRWRCANTPSSRSR